MAAVPARSSLAQAFRRAYDAVCGRHPQVRPWHFQYLATIYLYRGLKRELANRGGVVLDVGCGDKPYRPWFGGKMERYIGIDIFPGPQVDHVIDATSRWPIEDGSVDTLLCTQVFEHAEVIDHTLSEIRRVVKPGGVVVASYPFCYNEHGAPHDFRRISAFGAAQLFPGWEVLHLERQGAVGSTSAILLLNWVEVATSRNLVLRLLKGLLLPWVLFSGLVNLFALILDSMDRTESFYNNVLAVYRKPG